MKNLQNDSRSVDNKVYENINELYRLLSTKFVDIIANVVFASPFNESKILDLRKQFSLTSAKLNLQHMYVDDSSEKGLGNPDIIKLLKTLVNLLSNDLVSSTYATENVIDTWTESAIGLRNELSSKISRLSILLMDSSNTMTIKDSPKSKENSRGIQIVLTDIGNLDLAFTDMVSDVMKLGVYLQKIMDLTNPLMDKITIFMNTYLIKKMDEDTLKDVMRFLGNAEFKLNQTLTIMNKYKKLNKAVNTNSFVISKMIMYTQDKFVSINNNLK